MAPTPVGGRRHTLSDAERARILERARRDAAKVKETAAKVELREAIKEQAVARVRRETVAYVREVVELATTELVKTFVDAVLRDTKYKQQQLVVLAQVFRQGLQNDAAIQTLHQRIGELAQASVAESFETLIEAQEGPASARHYRAGQNRLAGGVMRRALDDAEFFVATSRGLEFANTTRLNQEAAHWHRLAFGAKGRGQGSTVSAQVTFGSTVAGALGYQEPPSPAFSMPLAVWFDGEGKVVPPDERARGQHAFGPVSKDLRKRSMGIVGRDFFAAGITSIARHFPRAYLTYYEDLFEAYERTGRGVLAQVERSGFPVGRLGRPQFTEIRVATTQARYTGD